MASCPWTTPLETLLYISINSQGKKIIYIWYKFIDIKFFLSVNSNFCDTFLVGIGILPLTALLSSPYDYSFSNADQLNILLFTIMAFYV